MKFKWWRGLTLALLLLTISSSAFVFIAKKTYGRSKLLSIMTLEERYYLGDFLHGVLFRDDFSYALFGSKPIAFTSFDKSIPFNITYDGVSMSHLKERKGFDVFKKYCDFVSRRNIFMRFCDSPDYSSILIVNKKNFLNIFDKYKDDFKQVLGPEITGEDLLAQIVDNENFAGAIKKHEALLGILLGYGRDNAWMFHNWRTMLRESEEFDPPLKQKDFGEIKQRMKPFSTCLSNRRSFLKKHSIPLPHFMADPDSSETKELKEKYGKEQEQIVKIFAGRNFLDVVLEHLMGR